MTQRTPRIRGWATVGLIMLFSSGIGCSSTECDPPHKPFSLEKSFSERDLQDYLAVTGTEREDADCESICEQQYALSTDEHVDSIESCMLMIEPVPGDMPDDIAGSVKCTGDAVEYLCA